VKKKYLELAPKKRILIKTGFQMVLRIMMEIGKVTLMSKEK